MWIEMAFFLKGLSDMNVKIAVKKLNIYANGIKEGRRGKKLFPGDKVVIQGKEYEVTK